MPDTPALLHGYLMIPTTNLKGELMEIIRQTNDTFCRFIPAQKVTTQDERVTPAAYSQPAPARNRFFAIYYIL